MPSLMETLRRKARENRAHREKVKQIDLEVKQLARQEYYRSLKREKTKQALARARQRAKASTVPFTVKMQKALGSMDFGLFEEPKKRGKKKKQQLPRLF